MTTTAPDLLPPVSLSADALAPVVAGCLRLFRYASITAANLAASMEALGFLVAGGLPLAALCASRSHLVTAVTGGTV